MVEVKSLLEESICEMTSRVGRIGLVRTDEMHRQLRSCNTLLLRTTGDYEALLLLSMEDSLVRAIVQNMKHGKDVEEEELRIYIVEYYNILCGYFISHFNQRQGLKARFGVPQLVYGHCVSGISIANAEIRICYNSQYGLAEFCYMQA